MSSAVLDEADVLGVAAEALPAAHEPILPDQSMGVRTHPADAGAGPVVLGVRVPDVGVAHLRLLLPPPLPSFSAAAAREDESWRSVKSPVSTR
jgi:hypothetical protein